MTDDTCKDKGCKKTVEDLDKYVFGDTPGSDIRNYIQQMFSGLKLCIDKKVPKLWLWAFVAVFATSFIGGGVTLYSDVQGGKKDHKQSVEAIQRMEGYYEKISDKVDEVITDLATEKATRKTERVAEKENRQAERKAFMRELKQMVRSIGE